MTKIIPALCSISLIFLTSCSSSGNQAYSSTSETAAEITAETAENMITDTQSCTSTYTDDINLYAEASSDTASDLSENIEDDILMAVVYESFSASYQQSVSVLDKDGNIHSASYTEIPGISGSMSENFSFDSQNWYEKLIEIKQLENEDELQGDTVENVRKFINNIYNYTSCSLKSYQNVTTDYGVQYLYGIYHDENNVPQYVLLCSYGDYTTCIDNSDVTMFVNELTQTSLFYTMGFEY